MSFDRTRLLQRVAALVCRGSGDLSAMCRRSGDATVCRTRLRLSTAQWVAGLPALGDVLYLAGRTDCTLPAQLPRGVLIESAELAPLLRTRTLAAAGAITADGPREWIECQDGWKRVVARLYLLPDTDYLAWDALQDGACPAVEEPPPLAPALWHPVSARLLRFRVRELAGMQLVGAEAGFGASSLGRELAARIARDEALLR